MKTQITTQRTKRILTSVFMLSMVFTMSFSQGLLIEGATKLFKSFMKSEAEPSSMVFTASYSPAAEQSEKSFNLNGVIRLFAAEEEVAEVNFSSRESYPLVVKSFTVGNLALAYENEPVAEQWMTESFSNNFETVPVVEDWMTDSFSEEFEPAVMTEEWMTVSLADSFEEEIVKEQWMTESFYQDMETPLTLENWMTESFSNFTSEEALETEEWMYDLFELPVKEERIIVENWMTTPLFTYSEEALEVEEWMTELFN